MHHSSPTIERSRPISSSIGRTIHYAPAMGELRAHEQILEALRGQIAAYLQYLEHERRASPKTVESGARKKGKTPEGRLLLLKENGDIYALSARGWQLMTSPPMEFSIPASGTQSGSRCLKALRTSYSSSGFVGACRPSSSSHVWLIHIW